MDAAPWPEADRLFRADDRWLGADAAYSVPLSGGRTLWLFGDTFHVPTPGMTRAEARLVHNTIGIQDGPDPSTARLTWHHGGTTDAPEPFFAAPAGTWLWPMAGARAGAHVVVFFMRVRSARPDLPSVVDAWRSEGSLEFFEVFDWAAALVRNPDDPVERWEVAMLDTPPAVNRVMPGAGAVVDGGYLYAYGWRDGHELQPGRLRRRPRYRGYRRPRLAFVLRWPVPDVPDGLHDPQWWCGDGWSTDAEKAVPVVDDPGTEFTVHRDRSSGRFCLVEASPRLLGVDGIRALRVLKRHPKTHNLLRALGLVKVSIAVRRGPAPEGPWSAAQRVYTPRFRRDVLVYAGKAHPQLEGPGLVCTFAQIAMTADRTLSDERLYYPRFVVVDQSRGSRTHTPSPS